MGIFSSIGKALGNVAKVAGVVAAPFTGGASLAATLGSTALDVGSMLYQNSQSKKAASTAFAKSKNASDTAYQRAVADMRAAGLNPILAYSQGGASTPTAQAASVAPLSNRAATNAMTLSQVQNTQQATRTSAAQEGLTREEAVGKALENEGMRKVPPELRALAQMGGGTAAAAGAAGKGIAAFSKTPLWRGSMLRNFLQRGFKWQK